MNAARCSHWASRRAFRNPKCDDKRTQIFPAIEVIILRGVDDIEPGDPANYSKAKNHWRQSKLAGLCQPRADWSNREREAEKKMRRVRETFRERVKENDQQRRDCQRSGHSIDGERGEQKAKRADNEKNER